MQFRGSPSEQRWRSKLENSGAHAGAADEQQFVSSQSRDSPARRQLKRGSSAAPRSPSARRDRDTDGRCVGFRLASIPID